MRTLCSILLTITILWIGKFVVESIFKTPSLQSSLTIEKIIRSDQTDQAVIAAYGRFNSMWNLIQKE